MIRPSPSSFVRLRQFLPDLHNRLLTVIFNTYAVHLYHTQFRLLSASRKTFRDVKEVTTQLTSSRFSELYVVAQHLLSDWTYDVNNTYQSSST